MSSNNRIISGQVEWTKLRGKVLYYFAIFN